MATDCQSQIGSHDPLEPGANISAMADLPGLSDLPEPLREAAARAWSRVPDSVGAREWPETARVIACSEFAAAACAADPEGMAALGSRDWNEPGTRAFYGHVLKESRSGDRSYDFEATLRRFRRVECARIAWRDLAGLADLETTLQELSDLADACINAAYAVVESELIERYGTPRDKDGRAQRLVVLALGKLGAHELNFSSDVDLMFAFPENGTSDGDKGIENEEWFTRFGRKLIKLLDDVTGDGFVYRVDMRLRPFGDSGPLALSFGAMESYYQEHGRDWERYALIKARAVTGSANDATRLLASLRPFVFRRYLDFGSFEQLRRMKGKIEREVARRDLAGNIKLGPGGIREVEFVGQAYQLIRGGSEPPLQERRILRVLDLLRERRHLAAEAVTELKDAYRFLRRVENRLQAQHDQQVHELPDDELGRARLASAMGFDDWSAFEAGLERVRKAVTARFDAVFFGPRDAVTPKPGGVGVVWRDEERDGAPRKLASAGFTDPEAALARIAGLRGGAYWRSLGDDGRDRMDKLVPAILHAAAAHENPDAVLARLLRVVEAIGRRISYLALLLENPNALGHLARLCSASSLVADRVARAPLLLDELLDPRIFTEPPTRANMAEELEQMLDGIGIDDLERRMDTLRAFQQAAVLRIAVADITGLLPLMKVSDRLTELAEIVLASALDTCWHHLAAKHGEPDCGFAIVGYGKLGGLELAYGSDLDLVFLHDATGEARETDGEQPVDVAVFLARLGQRLVNFLATPTGAGVLYEVDTRLRPSGSSGLLVSGVDAFEGYQREEAWTWEHQAMLRARAVAGTASIGERFAAIRRDILGASRDPAKLKQEVAAMRGRMREELAAGGAETFDLKQDAGGIADIEFLVQYLVLAYAHEHPTVLEWTDNIRQLESLVACGVLDQATGAALTEAYKTLRERVHRLGLQGEPALVPDTEFATERALVTDLWKTHLL